MVFNIFGVKKTVALHAVISMDRTMKFKDIAASCLLVQAIYVLRYDSGKFPQFFELC